MSPDTKLLATLAGFFSDGYAPQALPAAGGDIASAWHLRQEGGEQAFLKMMRGGSGVLAAEAEGLAELAYAEAVRVPTVLGQGHHEDQDWLLLEYLPLQSPSTGAWAALGRQLSAQHGVTASAHGWQRDNFIGATTQPNTRASDWRQFYRDARLGHQLRLARARGLDEPTATRVEAVMQSLETLVPHQPEPSLLHGDLWSGNLAAVGEQPVLYDPAVYYGDAEADLAMLELFGAPPRAFWDAYTERRPLRDGYALRRDLYNLYHILNHFNLFGGGFGCRARQLCDGLLAEVGA